MGPSSNIRSVVERNTVMRRVLVNQDTDTDICKLVCDVIWPLIVNVGNMLSANGRYKYNGLTQKHIRISVGWGDLREISHQLCWNALCWRRTSERRCISVIQDNYVPTASVNVLNYGNTEIFVRRGSQKLCPSCLNHEYFLFTPDSTEGLSTLTEVFPCFFLSCKANARV